MKSLFIGMALFAATLFNSCAFAGSHLVATLQETTPPGVADRILVTLTVKNEGDEPVHIFKPVTPFMETGAGLGNDVFEIRNLLGKRAPYIGDWGYYGPPRMRFFLLLKPGEFVEREVDLTDQYDFEGGGAFTIKYVLRQWNKPEPAVSTDEERASFRPGTEDEVESNVLTVKVAARRTVAVRLPAAMCESEKYAAVQSAWMKARSIANDAEVVTQNLKDKTSHSRYRRWFGDSTLSHEADDNDTPGKRFQDHVVELVDATFARLNFGTFLAQCDPCVGWSPDTAARAVTLRYYEVTLCPKFFELLEGGSSPSRVGTLIHEFTHFERDGRGPTAHDYMYGYSSVQALATNDPRTAIRNADNYEFYITDTTPYGETSDRPVKQFEDTFE